MIKQRSLEIKLIIGFVFVFLFCYIFNINNLMWYIHGVCGNEHSMLELGYWHRTRGHYNYEKSKFWFELAAKRNSSTAMFELYNMSEHNELRKK